MTDTPQRTADPIAGFEIRFRLTFRDGVCTVLFAKNIHHALERGLSRFEVGTIVRVEEEP